MPVNPRDHSDSSPAPAPAASEERDEFASFLSEVSRELEGVVGTGPWKRRLAEAAPAPAADSNGTPGPPARSEPEPSSVAAPRHDVAGHPPDPPLDPWFLSSSRVAWEWISLDERLVEEPR